MCFYWSKSLNRKKWNHIWIKTEASVFYFNFYQIWKLKYSKVKIHRMTGRKYNLFSLYYSAFSYASSIFKITWYPPPPQYTILMVIPSRRKLRYIIMKVFWTCSVFILQHRCHWLWLILCSSWQLQQYHYQLTIADFYHKHLSYFMFIADF